jgi:hypothetical protein
MASRIRAALMFLLILLVLDRGVAFVLDEMLQAGYLPTSQLGQMQATLARSDVDVIVFGSSRAVHHVNPAVLRDELGIESQVTGGGGQGLAFARMAQDLVLRHGSRARVHVLQVNALDLYDPHREQASIFGPYAKESPVVYDVLARSSWEDRVMLWCATCRYNSLLMTILMGLRADAEYQPGFVGLVGRLRPEFLGPPAPDEHQGVPRQPEFSPESLRLLREFVRTGRDAGLEVLVFVGPRYLGGAPRTESEVRAIERIGEIVREEGGVFAPLTEATDPELERAELFRDRGHLNARGAAVFTRRLAREIAPMVD